MAQGLGGGNPPQEIISDAAASPLFSSEN